MSAVFCARCGRLTSGDDGRRACPHCGPALAAGPSEAQQRRVLRRLVRRGLVPRRILREVLR